MNIILISQSTIEYIALYERVERIPPIAYTVYAPSIVFLTFFRLSKVKYRCVKCAIVQDIIQATAQTPVSEKISSAGLIRRTSQKIQNSRVLIPPAAVNRRIVPLGAMDDIRGFSITSPAIFFNHH